MVLGTEGLQGSIPARAGSSASPGRVMPPIRVHPRTRGEQVHRRLRVPAPLGPSPHARGAGLGPLLVPGLLGSIPARAGSSFPTRAFTGRRPHSEQQSEIRTTPPPNQTEHRRIPHAHSAQTQPHTHQKQQPAATALTFNHSPGPTRQDTTPSNTAEESYPRRPLPVSTTSVVDASKSPRAWGAGLNQKRKALLVGSIPARVGSSSAAAGGSDRRWDHPHVRGEQARRTPVGADARGLLRGRGEQLAMFSTATRGGPVPAHAESRA